VGLFRLRFTFKSEAIWILAFALGPLVLGVLIAILFFAIERMFQF
jgi:hypothetical protein